MNLQVIASPDGDILWLSRMKTAPWLVIATSARATTTYELFKPMTTACLLRARSAGQPRELKVSSGQPDRPPDVRKGRLTHCTHRPAKQGSAGQSITPPCGRPHIGVLPVDLEHFVIASSGDMAYTVGFERMHVSVDGGPRRDMTLRVTHIYRRIDGDWKLVHRHADFPPSDPRSTSAG
jgi:SnoaL-like domain